MSRRETPPDLILGTAMWGWTVAEATCFQLLDEFYQRGGRRVDGATNYPINKVAEDFRKAENILARWCRERQVDDLEIIMKVGSLNNMMTPDQNLSPSFLMLCAEEYRHRFGANLRCLMIHWDNREEHDAIRESLLTLNTLRTEGLQVGLSGIRHPEVYAKILAELNWRKVPTEMKHNLLYSDHARYAPLHGCADFIAYGINAGGIKLDASAYSASSSLSARGGRPEQHQALIVDLRKLITAFTNDQPSVPTPSSMNHLGLLYAAYHPGISGILLGTSKVEQLRASYAWLETLFTEDYGALYEALKKRADAGKD